jgi:GNAT superfamily N-acetyltransferase
MADIAIRTAEVRDANFLSWLILTAGRAHVRKGIWEVILGMPEEQCVHFLRLLSATLVPHLFHHSCYLVADVDSVPRAGLGGYDPNISGNSALFQALPEVLKRLGGGSPSMSQDGAPPRILKCIPEPVEGAWMIDSVAALPEFRRQGIVSKLLEAVMNQGRDKGFRHAQVNIYIGNTSAQRLYEKHGFAILDEMRDSYFEAEIGSPGMARMLRDL